MRGLSKERERRQTGLVDDDESRFEPTDTGRFEKKYPSVKNRSLPRRTGTVAHKILAEALAAGSWDVLSGSVRCIPR